MLILQNWFEKEKQIDYMDRSKLSQSKIMVSTLIGKTRLKGFSPKHDLNTFEFLIFQR